MQPSDETLMQAVSKGQIDQLAVLFSRYRDPLYGFIYRRTNGNSTLAEDLLQDTFEKVIKYRSSFKINQSFKAWLYTIARNNLNDRYKHQQRSPIQQGVELTTLACTGEFDASGMEIREEQQQIRLALSGLSEPYREVIDLAWKRELKYAEIANLLGTSENNIKVRMHRACKQLRANYQKLNR